MTFSELTICVYIFAVNLKNMSKNSPVATALKKQAMIKALEANFGNIVISASKAGITPQTHYRWCKEDDAYYKAAESLKDIGLRNVKESLLDIAMQKIRKGDSSVLNKMLGIFLKEMPEEMKIMSRYNNVPFKPLIRIAPHPNDFYAKDPMTQLAVKQFMEDQEKDGKLGEIRKDLVQKYKEGTIGEGENKYK
jgi:hypothetical protein